MIRAGVCLTFLSGIGLLLAADRSAAPGAAPSGAAHAMRLSVAPEATEYWELAARFDNGYRLFVRLGITNEGPGDRTAGALWYLVHPDGRVSEFRNGRAQSRWKLSPDHLRLDIASSSLDLHTPVRRLAIDSHTQGAKIDLWFPADEKPPRPATRPGAAFQIETVQIAAPIEGTIWVRGMAAPIAVRGTTFLIHGWSDDSIPTVVQRHIGFIGQAPDLVVYLSDVTTPAGNHDSWLALERGGAVDYQSADVKLQFDQFGSLAADRKYPLPGRLRISDGHLELEVRPERVLVRRDPLAVIPQPFRLLFSLKVDPAWIWIDASFHLTFAAGAETPPITVDGRGILALNFVNPAPPR